MSKMSVKELSELKADKRKGDITLVKKCVGFICEKHFILL